MKSNSWQQIYCAIIPELVTADSFELVLTTLKSKASSISCEPPGHRSLQRVLDGLLSTGCS